jgi:simple sugar transport system permease protein
MKAGWLAVAAVVAVLAAVLGLLSAGSLAPVRRRGLVARLLLAAALGLSSWALLAALGYRAAPLTIPATNLNPSFVLALLSALGVWFFMFRTRYGYELRAAGLAPKAAEYAGVNLPRNTVMAMAMSGALAGLTATHYVLGGALEEYALRQSIPTRDGFDGIAVALLGATHPLGDVLAAFLFGVLKNGGSALNIAFTGLTRDVVSMLMALVVLFIAAKGFLPATITHPLRRAQALGDLPEPDAPQKGGRADG